MKENYNEIWKQIDSYEDYQISNWGRVKSFKKGKERILRPRVVGAGYLQVILYKDGKTKPVFIHRLVANAFINNPDNLPEVNHKDENKQNNLVTNLEWCDAKYNSNYGTSIQRIADKLTNGPLSKQVGQYSKDGNLIKIWPSMIEAHRNGFNVGHICSCCKGKYKTHGGFIWRYIDN